jgi:hypothetical protein
LQSYKNILIENLFLFYIQSRLGPALVAISRGYSYTRDSYSERRLYHDSANAMCMGCTEALTFQYRTTRISFQDSCNIKLLTKLTVCRCKRQDHLIVIHMVVSRSSKLEAFSLVDRWYTHVQWLVVAKCEINLNIACPIKSISFTLITKCSILPGSLDSMPPAALDSFHPGMFDYVLLAVTDSQQLLTPSGDQL